MQKTKKEGGAVGEYGSSGRKTRNIGHSSYPVKSNCNTVLTMSGCATRITLLQKVTESINAFIDYGWIWVAGVERERRTGRRCQRGEEEQRI